VAIWPGGVRVVAGLADCFLLSSAGECCTDAGG
jgi:hypothetical protein